MSSLFYRGIYGMVNRIRILFCALACFFSISTYADDLPANPRNDTPAQSLKRLQNNFKSQANYDAGMKRNLAELDARIYMNEGTKRTNVEQMLTRSGVLESGAKAEVVSKVTQPADTAKAAKTLADRLGKAKNYAKNVGKASIPTFVGMAAFHGLMEGIGWVMDEGGKVTKTPDEDSAKYSSPVYYSTDFAKSYSSYQDVAEQSFKVLQTRSDNYHSLISIELYQCGRDGGRNVCVFTIKHNAYRADNPTEFRLTIFESLNPDYKPDHVPEASEATPEQIETALKNALESNNPALASAIAEAIKSAYSYDDSEGQDNSSNTLVIGTANDMNQAVDRAFDNPTTNATTDKPSGYYKITDGEKTIEGYVTTPDTSAKTDTETKTTTTTDPVTGNQTTTGTSTGSLQLPAFCTWAAIVCDWINWTKEEPQEPELKPVFEEINVPYTPFSIAKFNAQCPPDENLSLNLMGQEMSFVFPMKPFCDFFSGIKPFVIALASFWAVKLIGNASFNSGN